MKFTSIQCLEIIEKPRNASLLSRAKVQEGRLQMHCDPILEIGRGTYAVQEFLNWVSTFLPADKMEKFRQLLRFPIETVDLTESIFDELSKFLDAPDANTRLEFTSPSYEDDFTWFMDEVMRDENFWRDNGMRALRTGINSFLVVDLPSVQLSDRPEPYCFVLPVSRVFDAVLTADQDLEYLVYWDGPNRLVFLDELAYRVFVLPEETGQWKLASEKYHTTYVMVGNEYGDVIEGVGKVPACPFYRTIIHSSNPFDKRGPITSALGKLDWLLFWRISKKYLDLYGAWPIVVSYEKDCDYRDDQGNECDRGVIYIPGQAHGCRPCPACSQRSGLIGPGSHFEVPAPKDGQDADLMQNPIKFVESSNDKLEYGTKEIERLGDEIFLASVGYLNTNPTKEAINEKQVKSTFESRETILDRIREQFDQNRKFVIDTMAALRYGSLFVRSEVFGGREYFLQTADDIIRRYGNAKKEGLPMFEIARLREAYSKTMFKNNAIQYLKSTILAQLEPYPDLSPTEMRALGLDTLDPENYLLKLNFSNYVARFEREQMSVIEFGENIAFSSKIAIIHSKILEYVRESIKSAIASPIARALAGRDGGPSGGTAAGSSGGN